MNPRVISGFLFAAESASTPSLVSASVFGVAVFVSGSKNESDSDSDSDSAFDSDSDSDSDSESMVN